MFLRQSMQVRPPRMFLRSKSVKFHIIVYIRLPILLGGVIRRETVMFTSVFAFLLLSFIITANKGLFVFRLRRWIRRDRRSAVFLLVRIGEYVRGLIPLPRP